MNGVFTMNKYSSLISIIVPVYNVEKYLLPCINSILQQTYPHFELLLVDDGSTDHSGEICDRVGKTDPRISVYHKSNGGLSDARNYGVKYAQGEYLTFIDSDDTVSLKFLEILLTNAKLNEADVVQCTFTLSEEKLNTGSQKSYSYDRVESLKQFLIMGRVYMAACGKLYKRELFKNILFPYGKINEDNFTVYKLVYRSTRTVCIDQSLYWHRMREGSIMHTAFSLKNMELLNVGSEIRDFLSDEQSLFKNELEYFEYRTTLGVLNYLVSSQNYQQYISQMLYLRDRALSVDKKNPFLSTKNRFTNILIFMNPYIYRLLIKLYKERKSHGVKIR